MNNLVKLLTSLRTVHALAGYWNGLYFLSCIVSDLLRTECNVLYIYVGCERKKMAFVYISLGGKAQGE